MFEAQFFLHKKPNEDKLLRYGFTPKTNGYQYAAMVMDGQFRLTVFIAADGQVSTQMIDSMTGEEYTLYKVPSSVGSFVGEVRSACEDVLTDIAQNCFEPDIFRGEQTHAVIDFVREQFGDELEFLWEKFPNNAIWRRKDNRKWYGLLLTLPKRKLGLQSEEIAEVVVLRLQPERMAETVDHKRYFPGWHMNKKSWYTIILDGTVPTAEIGRRLEESYRLAVK